MSTIMFQFYHCVGYGTAQISTRCMVCSQELLTWGGWYATSTFTKFFFANVNLSQVVPNLFAICAHLHPYA